MGSLFMCDVKGLIRYFSSNQRFCCSYFLLGLLMLWISTFSIKAQITDSIGVIHPQPLEMANRIKYKPQKQLPRAALNSNAGYGRRFGKIANELNDSEKEYFSHLMSGFVWDASFDFFFNEKFGIKTTFYQYQASHSAIADIRYSRIDTNDKITYFGPAFVYRISFGQNPWIFSTNAGMGYIEYREKRTFSSPVTSSTYPVRTKFYGATVGVQIGAGLECKLTPHLIMGTNIMLTSGEITKFDYNMNGMKWSETFDAGKGEGVGQISLGVGLRYYIR